MGSFTNNNCLNTIAVVDMMKQGYSIEEITKKVKFPSLSSCLNEMMGRRDISVQVTAGMADINPATLHKIISKKMVPSRNVLLRIAFALEMSFEETQVLLKSGNCAALSGNRQRDLDIINGIVNKETFDEVNEALKKHGHPDLYSKG